MWANQQSNNFRATQEQPRAVEPLQSQTSSYLHLHLGENYEKLLGQKLYLKVS